MGCLVFGALTDFEFSDSDGAFTGEDADPSRCQVVDSGAERNLAVDDGDARVAGGKHHKKVLAGGEVAGAFQLDVEGDVPGDMPLGVPGDGAGPSIKNEAVALGFQAQDVGLVAVVACPQEETAFGRVRPDVQHGLGVELRG